MYHLTSTALVCLRDFCANCSSFGLVWVFNEIALVSDEQFYIQVLVRYYLGIRCALHTLCKWLNSNWSLPSAFYPPTTSQGTSTIKFLKYIYSFAFAFWVSFIYENWFSDFFLQQTRWPGTDSEPSGVWLCAFLFTCDRQCHREILSR